jgi:hypothetical protein
MAIVDSCASSPRVRISIAPLGGLILTRRQQAFGEHEPPAALRTPTDVTERGEFVALQQNVPFVGDECGTLYALYAALISLMACFDQPW